MNRSTFVRALPLLVGSLALYGCANAGLVFEAASMANGYKAATDPAAFTVSNGKPYLNQ